MGGRRWTAVFVAVAVVATGLVTSAIAAVGAPPPGGFVDQKVLEGLEFPTNIALSPDGRVFVSEKSGLVKVFDNFDDPTPSVFADLRTEVYDASDEGMTGLTLNPNFPTQPYVYLSFSYDAPIGGIAPTYGQPGQTFDDCTAPVEIGCVASARVVRLTANGNTGTNEKVLVSDWCQAGSAGHSIQEVMFGPDGMLYVGAGDGARPNPTDYGQFANTCNDPPGGTSLTPPTAEGGSLHAQDLRTSGDPLGLDGTLIRIDPDTGAGVAGNPLFASADANARRIIANGVRNPFRFTFRPGTNEVWIGDVGWKTREEIDRLLAPTDGTVDNFGWPCYEGTLHQAAWDQLNVNICEDLYTTTGQVQPYFQYRHDEQTVPGGDCVPGNQGAVATPRFYTGNKFPAHYHNALFFSDYARGCLFVMPAGANGLPDPNAREEFSTQVGGIVDLEQGADGNLYYVNVLDGSIHRISYDAAGNQPPVAMAHSDVAAGAAPLTVHFDGTMSSDPNGDPLTYAWDLDGDGQFDDSTSATPVKTYTALGPVTVRLRVTDNHSASATAELAITVGGGAGAPTPAITSPFLSTTWQVGQTITFAGNAVDAEDGTLPASGLDWTITLFHCPDGSTTNCHQHPVGGKDGAASGTFIAPDHEYYAFIRLTLLATDKDGHTGITTRDVQPQTRTVEVVSSPPGVTLGLNDEALPAPFMRTVIRNSTNTVSAPPTAVIGGKIYKFDRWSDCSPATHDLFPSLNTTRTAFYVPATSSNTTICSTPPPPPPPPPPGYWTVEANGRTTAFGGVSDYGDAPTGNAMDLESTPTGKGYWIVNAGGSVYAFGDAPFKGSASGLAAGELVTSISRTATGQGYWLFTTRGKVLSFGDAVFYGDLRSIPLNGPILDSVSTPSGLGYFMVGSDGGVFSFGDAKFAGSTGGMRLNAPVQSLVPDGDGLGYWLVASDGGVFAFDAPFRGSLGGVPLNRPVTGMVRYGNGYLMVGEDGGIFNFSDQPFVGSLGSTPPATPVVSVATSS